MKQLIESIARTIPKEAQNNHLIKRQDIYIPYCEIGVTCLTKDISQINTFYETILKFIDIGVTDIYEIATVMGIEFKLLKEVIVDMVDKQYLVTSENKVLMTPKGKQSLESRKVVTIRKRNISQIIVNMITGEIEEKDNVQYTNALWEELCLNEEQIITKDFLDKHYANINEIYQKNQIEYNVFNTNYLSRELYKILDIAYNQLIYKKEELLIFKNNETNSFEFRITGDIAECYLNCFYNQIRDIVSPGLENFFERDWNFSKQNKKQFVTDTTDEERAKEVVKELYGSEIITDELIKKFTQERALIGESEISTYFSHQQEMEYEGIIISCKRLRKLLNKGIISSINQIQNKKIIISYDANEYKIEEFLNKNFSELIRQKKIMLIKNDDITENIICFYPNVYICFKEIVENIFERPFTIVNGKIEFEEEVIKEKMDETIAEKTISFELPKKKGKDESQFPRSSSNQRYHNKKGKQKK